MSIPQPSGITFSDGPGYREARWKSPYAKPVIGMLVFLALMAVGMGYYAYSNITHSHALHRDATLAQLPFMLLPLFIFVVAIIPLIGRWVSRPACLRLYPDRLEVRVMGAIALDANGQPVPGREPVRTVARGDVKEVMVNTEVGAPCLIIATTQGTLQFGHMLPAADLATLAQALGGWR
jgi:hypothetical protein